MLRKIILITILLMAVNMPAAVFAQDLPYYFQVNKEDVHVYWNSDGTMSVDYVWVFTNQPNSHAIDFVDVGMPNYEFDMGTVKADVNGVPVSVSQNDYAGNGSGFAIVLGGKSIPAGGAGTVHVYVGKIEQVLYPDDEDEAYASAAFAPTFFGSEYVTGTTDLTLTYHLPKDMAPEEPRWHAAPSGFPSEPETAYDVNNHITYTWNSPAADASKYYLFGASFPRSYVPADAIYTPPAQPLISADTVFIFLCLGFFGFMFIGIPVLAANATRKRKMQYLPPKIAIEGHGIKRGLTAVEAAILLEQPLDKVFTMILFGTLKKNAAQVIKRDPLEVQANDPLPEKMNDYERDFLKAFKEPAGKERQKLLQDMAVRLVKTVSEKMKGFSRRETIDYYKSITEKAWAMVEAENTPEVKSQKFDEALEWTMLDKEYDDRTRRVFHGPIFLPYWWGSYNPTYRSASSSAPTSAPVSRGNALPGADFAAQMVTGVQTFSQKVVGNINTFTERVTNTTNPPPKPTASRSGRGGGGGRSCACACACAGCACACAGGGR
ncbi:MAG: hypothetical protein IH589_11315 [Anaerolineales bacterium]|nr:hypothetical protein [Anaerolineales bacterium]